MIVSLLVFWFTFIVGVILFLMGIKSTSIILSNKFTIPKSYVNMYSWFVVTFVCLLFLSVKVGYYFNYEGEVLATLTAIDSLWVVFIITHLKQDKWRELPLRKMLLRKIATEKDLEYRKLTSKDFAMANRIEYIPNVIVRERPSVQRKKYVARDNRYILLKPYRNGDKATVVEWYGEKNDCFFKILDNYDSFKSITNLEEILFQIITLYTDFIDRDIFIDFTGFAIKLEDEVTENYQGRATLVITDELIQNDNVEYEDRYIAKKYYLNSFIIHFIGWNFSDIARNNVLVKLGLTELKKLARDRGLYQV